VTEVRDVTLSASIPVFGRRRTKASSLTLHYQTRCTSMPVLRKRLPAVLEKPMSRTMEGRPEGALIHTTRQSSQTQTTLGYLKTRQSAMLHALQRSADTRRLILPCAGGMSMLGTCPRRRESITTRCSVAQSRTKHTITDAAERPCRHT